MFWLGSRMFWLGSRMFSTIWLGSLPGFETSRHAQHCVQAHIGNTRCPRLLPDWNKRQARRIKMSFRTAPSSYTLPALDVEKMTNGKSLWNWRGPISVFRSKTEDCWWKNFRELSEGVKKLKRLTSTGNNKANAKAKANTKTTMRVWCGAAIQLHFLSSERSQVLHEACARNAAGFDAENKMKCAFEAV